MSLNFFSDLIFNELLHEQLGLSAQLVILVNVDLALVFEDYVLNEEAVVDKFVDLEQVHTIVFLLLLNDLGNFCE